MNNKYNLLCLNRSILFSAVSFVAAVYCYFAKNGYINCSNVVYKAAILLFYGGAALSVIMFWMVNVKRIILENRIKNVLGKKSKKNSILKAVFSMGIFRFFSHRNTITVDVVLGILVIDLIVSYVLKIRVSWFADILKMMFCWFMYMHSILNGRNYLFFLVLVQNAEENRTVKD